MTFHELALYIKRIEETSSRLSITEILAELFEKLSSTEYEKTVYLLLGRLTPKYQTLNFQMAEKMVIRGIASSLQMDPKDFLALYKSNGDLGATTQLCKDTQPSMLQGDPSILQVFEKLLSIATKSGVGSQDEKIAHFSRLIQEVDPLSARYIVRIPLGVLRLGFSDMTVLDALSWMAQGDKSLRPKLQKAYHIHPDLGAIGKRLKTRGISEVVKLRPTLFTPILMMRAERLSSGKEIIDQIGSCAIEPKFDGFRLQVHKKDDVVKLYTRGLDDATFMYPDIVAAVKKEVRARDVILEGEAIGYDPERERFLPFQETVQRKRKYGIEDKVKEIPLKLFVFELLYLDGANYVSELFSKRRKALLDIIGKEHSPIRHGVIPAAEEIVDDPEKIETMFDEAITQGLEGIIAKKLDGTYQPGARGWNWIKFKRSYSSKIDDTIDCLVMGYDFGKGKRTSFGIGAFLAGIYDEKADKFMTIAKIGTGLTDEEWRAMKAQAEPLRTKTIPTLYDVDKMMDCDVWVMPGIVVEVKADEISRSPVHTAGRSTLSPKGTKSEQNQIAGYALRFPRLMRFRTDKSEKEVTSLSEIQNMYKSQRA